MAMYGSVFWKKAPFVKLLLAMIAGIIVQWRLQLGTNTWWIILSIAFIALLSFFIIPFFNRYRFAFVNGIVACILFFSIGAMLAWQKDVRNNKQWLGNFYQQQNGLIVT